MNRWLVGWVCTPSLRPSDSPTGGKPVPRFRGAKREILFRQILSRLERGGRELPGFGRLLSLRNNPAVKQTHRPVDIPCSSLKSPGGLVLETHIYLGLFLVALAAGFVDSIAGGGGLITLPALLGVGLPPQIALGTNKLQASFGSGSAAWHFGRAGIIDWRSMAAGVVFTAAGAAGGTALVRVLSADLLRQLIPCLLVAIAVFMLFQPRLGEVDVHPRMAPHSFLPVCGFALGFYDGFFGPGTGTFWAMAFVLGLGFNLTKATAHTKLMNFTSNIASLAVFLLGGQVHWRLGLTMGIGQWLGARLGAGLVLRRGARFIRPIFILVALAITARLLWKNWVG